MLTVARAQADQYYPALLPGSLGFLKGSANVN
jgi:hypothetical protein